MKLSKLLVLVLLGYVLTFAQESKNEVGLTKYQLEQITVISVKYPEKVLEVPFSVSLLSKKDLAGYKNYGSEEVFNKVPGVLAQSRFGNQDIRITIRGFGARGAGDRSNAGTSRGIRFLQDGFPETEPDGRTSFDMIDLNLSENIEILRSNASSLWGNASGGLINVSNVPQRGDFVELAGFGGSYKLLGTNIKANYLTDRGQIFAGVSNITFDGYRQHSRSSRFLLNAGIISYVGEATKVGLFLSGSSNVYRIPGPLTLAEYEADPTQSNATYLKNDERRFNRTGRIGVSVEHSINNYNVIGVNAYVNPKFLQRSERGTFRDFTRYHVGGNFNYKNVMEFSEYRNIFIVGADESYQDGAILFYNLVQPYNTRGTLKDNKGEGANSFGAYVQDDISFGSFDVLLGGRYDNITYRNESFLTVPTRTDKKSYEHFTPKAAIRYSFSKSHTIYFNFGGGIEVPAGNETDPAGTYGQDTVYLLNPLLEPIKSTTYELGTKHFIDFDGAEMDYLSYDLALYYIDIKNDLIPYQGGKFYFNAGKTNRMGVELGLEAVTKFGLDFSAAFTYANSKYKDYTVDSVHYKKPGKFADYSENKMAGLPDVFYNFALKYAPKFAKGFYVGFNLNGVGKYFVDDANTYEVPAYNILNASLGMDDFKLTNHLYLKWFLGVNNITDKKYAASAFINPDKQSKTNAPMYLEPGLPRNIVFSISLGIM